MTGIQYLAQFPRASVSDFHPSGCLTPEDMIVSVKIEPRTSTEITEDETDQTFFPCLSVLSAAVTRWMIPGGDDQTVEVRMATPGQVHPDVQPGQLRRSVIRTPGYADPSALPTSGSQPGTLSATRVFVSTPFPRRSPASPRRPWTIQRASCIESMTDGLRTRKPDMRRCRQT
ncbi:hypothetical protein [Thioalkalivibrio nitratireducens]|uniref:hypothetical protein n=1 Tax=Thioalkalivibrio nitratireducens TaxID=186931 RepID=UPI0012EDF695|nr:hypothetical protein [Thioalkalivibrio nitratireducens]